MQNWHLFFLFLVINTAVIAQDNAAGPYIKDYGKVYQIPNPDLETNTQMTYKVVYDIYDKQRDPKRVNRQLNTAARFLNMHGQAGVSLENLKVACVVHNKAGFDMMDNESYKEKYGVDNPNLPLLEQLQAAGVEIILCGQTAYSRKIDRERLAKPVKIGLSAMTAILELSNEGYHLIKF